MSRPRMTEEAALKTGREFMRLRCPTSPEADTERCRTELIKADDAHNHYGKRATWRLWFLWDLPEGVTATPDYTEVFVDDLTGEAWWFEDTGRPTETTWRNPWLKNKLQKEGRTAAV